VEILCDISDSHGGHYEDIQPSSGMWRCVIWYKLTHFSGVLTQ
jgi:hypothetical protein